MPCDVTARTRNDDLNMSEVRGQRSEIGSRPTISVIIITFNEADRLERALDSVRWADEIVVLDSGSTDGTPDVARRYAERVVVGDWHGFGPQKQRALELATGEWVLSLDADEEVEPALARSIEAKLNDAGSSVGFELEFRTFYLGRPIGARAWRRERHLRLFRKDRARFGPSVVHERVVVDGPVGRIESGVIRHYTYRDLSHQIEKMNCYSTLAARQLAEEGRRSGPLKPFFLAAARFLHHYILRGGVLDGRVGLIRSAFGAMDAFLKYAKLWEITRRSR